MQEISENQNNILNKITSSFLNNKSIVLVGMSGSGKTYWVKNELIPALEQEKNVVYFKDGDAVNNTEGDIFIFDEVETLFDREFLEKRHPDENPYYMETYLNKINLWQEKYKKFDKPCLYVITRNEYQEIQNLVQNFKHTDWDNREIETICFSTFLYHGSTTSNIKILEPRHRYSPAGKIEYDAIYATPMKGYAVAHSFPWSTDEGVDLDIVDGKVAFAVPESFKERLQVPISIYKISSENFAHTKEEETGRTWHTTKPVHVIDEEKFESVEIALKKFGANVIFKN